MVVGDLQAAVGVVGDCADALTFLSSDFLFHLSWDFLGSWLTGDTFGLHEWEKHTHTHTKHSIQRGRGEEWLLNGALCMCDVHTYLVLCERLCAVHTYLPDFSPDGMLGK